jgi:hypothetical protein
VAAGQESFSRYITEYQRTRERSSGNGEVVVGQHQLAQVFGLSVYFYYALIFIYCFLIFYWRQQVLGGLVAGALTVIVTNPLDVVKTVRQQ